MRTKLTQERANELFCYDPDTGLLTRKIKRRYRYLVGSIAGALKIDHNGCRYIVVEVDEISYMAHRVIWLMQTGEWPKNYIDHVNHDGTDNQWSNLRDVKHIENCRNRRLAKNNTSGIPGVSWHKKKSLWSAVIYVKGKVVSLYYASDFFEACCRRKSAEVKYGFHPNHGRTIEVSDD